VIPSIRVNETVPVERVADHDRRHLEALVVRFDRKAFLATLPPGAHALATASGTLGVTRFLGRDSLAMHGRDAWLAGDELATEASDPVRLSLGAPQPNPSLGTVAMTFGLPRPAAVAVAIYDVSGRRVRTLAAGPAAAGWHRLEWRGESDAGEAVRPGLFFVVMKAEGQSFTRRIVRVR
jgi:hypothetical protein